MTERKYERSPYNRCSVQHSNRLYPKYNSNPLPQHIPLFEGKPGWLGRYRNYTTRSTSESRCSIPKRSKIFFFLHSVKAGSGTDPFVTTDFTRRQSCHGEQLITHLHLVTRLSTAIHRDNIQVYASLISVHGVVFN
jgi:hypothetical protein